MYHHIQSTLRNIDITREPWQSGPPPTYIMARARNSDRKCPMCPAFCRGRMRCGHQWRQSAWAAFAFSSTCLFWKTGGRIRGEFRGVNTGRGAINEVPVGWPARTAVSPSSAGRGWVGGQTPVLNSADAQARCRILVGIVRRRRDAPPWPHRKSPEARCPRCVFIAAANTSSPGWHTALDLTNLLTCRLCRHPTLRPRA